MNNAKTISVEPGKITLAEQKNKERIADIMRVNILDREETSKNKVSALNFLFPTQTAAFSDYNKYSIPMRSVFAALMIISGIACINGSSVLFIHNMAVGILQLCFGSMLALGFFTRISMGAASTLFCIIGIMGLRNGYTDITSFTFMFGSLLFSLMGSGTYSLDTIMRKQIKRRKALNRHRNQENALSYKAFSYITKQF